MEILDTAVSWYKSADKALRLAALKLYSKDYLEEEVERRKKNNIKEKDKILKDKFEEIKKLFPVGSIVWSDDGTDKLPNLIISEPYITSEDKYTKRIVIGNEYDYWDKTKKTIIAKAFRIKDDDILIWDDKPEITTVNLEDRLYNLKKDKKDFNGHTVFVNLNDYHHKLLKDRLEYIKKHNKNINEYNRLIEEEEKELEKLQNHIPIKFKKDRVQEILEKYKDYTK